MVAPRVQGDPDPPVGVALGILQQVAHHPTQAPLVTANPHRVDRDRDGGGAQAHDRDLRQHDVIEVHVIRAQLHRPLIGGGEREQVVHQHRQPVHLV